MEKVSRYFPSKLQVCFEIILSLLQGSWHTHTHTHIIYIYMYTHTHVTKHVVCMIALGVLAQVLMNVQAWSKMHMYTLACLLCMPAWVCMQAYLHLIHGCLCDCVHVDLHMFVYLMHLSIRWCVHDLASRYVPHAWMDQWVGVRNRRIIYGPSLMFNYKLVRVLLMEHICICVYMECIVFIAVWSHVWSWSDLGISGLFMLVGLVGVSSRNIC